jgi:hypothetical protein
MDSPPDLDGWLPSPSLRVQYGRGSRAEADELWAAARQVRLADTGLLGRLVRWRIPGLRRELTVDELFREPPFMVLEEGRHALVSGLVGRIWTLRRDYPRLEAAADFEAWDRRGTARVVFAHWVSPAGDGASLNTEARVQGYGAQGRVGVAAVRPLVRRFAPLMGSAGLAPAVRAAEGQTPRPDPGAESVAQE